LLAERPFSTNTGVRFQDETPVSTSWSLFSVAEVRDLSRRCSYEHLNRDEALKALGLEI